MRFPAFLPVFLPLLASAFSLQADGTLRIDSPAANETVSGIVEITGTAAVPGMLRYRVEFAYDPNSTGTWFLIAEGITPVENGPLAQWDTSLISEGDYALHIAAFFADGSMREAVTLGIRVSRGTSAVPLPSVEAVTPAEAEPQTTPRAMAAFPAPTAEFGSKPADGSAASSSRGAAFLLGAVLAVIGFGAAGLRSRWLWWKRRRFIRNIRKSGKKEPAEDLE